MTITLNEQTSVYGNDVIVSDTVYTVTSGTVVGDDELNIDITKADGTIVGDYVLTATYNNANYNVTFVNGNYQITARALTITLNNQTSIYGEAITVSDVAYSVTAGTVVAEDNLNIDITKAEGTTVADYGLTATFSNANYAVTFVDGTYSITKRPISITLTNQTSVYGNDITVSQSAYSVTGEYSILVSDNINLVISKADGITVDSYPLTAVYNNSNYNVTFTDGTYTITERPITVQFSDTDNLIETGAPIYITVNFNALENDELNEVVTYSAIPDKAGQYTATATINNNNYILTGKTSIDFKIYPALITSEETDSILQDEVIVSTVDAGAIPLLSNLNVIKIEVEEELKIYKQAIRQEYNILSGIDAKAIYDISLISDNVEVQPNGFITIRLLLDAEYRNYKDLFVLHIADDGTVEKTISYRDGDYIVVVADHLSTFAIVGSILEDAETINYIMLIIILILVFIINTLIIMSLRTYAIKFNVNGGTPINKIKATPGQIIPQIITTKENCKFAGWYLDEELKERIIINAMPKKNITLYAKWEDKNKQNINKDKSKNNL